MSEVPRASSLRPSAPCFVMQGQEAAMDDPREIWANTPLDGTDGRNQLHYKSERIQVDCGETRRPPTTKPVDEAKRLWGLPE